MISSTILDTTPIHFAQYANASPDEQCCKGSHCHHGCRAKREDEMELINNVTLSRALRLCGKSILLGSASIMAAGAAHAQSAPQADAAASAGSGYGDIVVTARRREESIQRVPVAVTAVTSEQIAERGIQTTEDLQKLVPGVIFSGAGGSESPTFFIRGQGRDVIGAALPSVITYFNEVPLNARGSTIPTFDVANVQVLKGPQGTLFGRNTTGGAVLYYSQKPTYDFGGYAQATLGDYSWHALEGAVNVPLIADKLAVRVAGQYTSRAGYTKDMTGNRDPDNLNNHAFRVSVLAEPVEGLKNTTVFDYYWSRTNSTAVQALGFSPVITNNFGNYSNFIGYLAHVALAPVLNPAQQQALVDGFACTTSIDCNVDQQVARQLAAGPRKTWSNPNYQPENYSRVWGITNTTEFDLGGVSVKNIFGYRQSSTRLNSNSDGLPVSMLVGDTHDSTKQVSDELQISGKALGDKLNYILGAFYLKVSPNGEQVLPLQFLNPASISPDAWPISSSGNALLTDESKALFANVGYEIVPGLRFNAGFRHTWDKESICGYTDIFSEAGRAKSLADCKATVADIMAGGGGATGAAAAGIDKSAKFEANTWSVGLDYQATPDLFVYGVARRGYRAGNFNTPSLGGILTPYQTYTPQFVTDFEIGVKADWRMGGVRGRTNVAAFHSNFTKLQRQISAIPANFDGDNNPANDPTGTSVVVNGGKSRVQGIEVSGYISPVPSLTFDYGVSYIDAKFTELSAPPIFVGLAGGDAKFNSTPKWSYSVQGRYQLPVKLAGGDVVLRGSYYWVDDYIVGALNFPSHHTIDAAIDINHIADSGLNLSFFVNNLTNEAYLLHSVLSGNSPGVFSADYAAPRMYGVRARYNF
jgi:iron complex outermembrane receptor protein